MNSKIIWDFLINRGLTPAGAAGLMGNLRAESNLNPQNLQNSFNKKFNLTDEEYTNSVDNNTYKNFIKDGAGYGLAQWTYWTRKEKLLNYAKETKRSIGNLEVQLEFLIKELKESYPSVYKKLKNINSVDEASNLVLLSYERPANQGPIAQSTRISYSYEYYHKLISKEEISMSNYNKGKKVQLSKNFESTEFDCKCKNKTCTTTEIDPKLVEYLQKIRDYFGKAVTINSAYRCDEHNKSVGGANQSKHKFGQAADIKVSGVKPLKVAQYAEFIGIKGIGQYSNFVHIDTRTNKFFWYGNEQSSRSTFGGQSAFKKEDKQEIVTDIVVEEKPVESAPTQTQTSGDKVVVTGSSVNVRKGPGTQFSSVGAFSKGKEFDAVKYDGWTPILIDEEVCWISEKYSKKQ